MFYWKGKYKRNVEQKLFLLPGPRIVSVHSGCAIYAKKKQNYIKNSETRVNLLIIYKSKKILQDTKKLQKQKRKIGICLNSFIYFTRKYVYK